MLGLHDGELRMQAQGWDFTLEAIGNHCRILSSRVIWSELYFRKKTPAAGG